MKRKPRDQPFHRYQETDSEKEMTLEKLPPDRLPITILTEEN